MIMIKGKTAKLIKSLTIHYYNSLTSYMCASIVRTSKYWNTIEVQW